MRYYFLPLFFLLVIAVSSASAQQDEASSLLLPKSFSTFTLGSKMTDIPNGFKLSSQKQLSTGKIIKTYSTFVKERTSPKVEIFTIEDDRLVSFVIYSNEKEMRDYLALLKSKHSIMITSETMNKTTFEDSNVLIMVEINYSRGECIYSLLK